MHEDVVRKLLALNQNFYNELAEPFAESRVKPQPGFFQLLLELPQPCDYLLDVGCGDGRLGRFLQARRAVKWYTGVDFSAELLAKAEAATMGDFHQRDLSQPESLYGLGQYEAIACLAVLQHIPGLQHRQTLMQEMARALTPDGRIFISTWQFVGNERQQRKIVDWATVGLHEQDVDPNDYLLTWQREDFGLRYVRLIDEQEIANLAATAGLQVVGQFRADGREGNLSLYTILEFAQ
ncbi:MAG: class I SAM-dependent methyltransferase [Chloroflexi bacterium]|nr:class I SAM-dependent methyltransferase [Chloroflexota bacterium]